MAKKEREKIKLLSTADTGFYYTTTKNRKNTPDKLEFKKYDPVAKKHVVFKEAKIKWPRLRRGHPERQRGIRKKAAQAAFLF